jgi:RNA 2',3'-cyclic 3'-phosphodiesterase
MLYQMNLFGFDDGPPGTSGPAVKLRRAPRKPHKLFFALRPDAEGAREIASLWAALNQRYKFGGQPLLPDRLHITLRVIGEYDETPQAVIDAARQAGDAVVADAFDVMFDRAMTFVGAKAYVLGGGEGVEPVKDLWLKLGIELANTFSFKKSSFTPHMTLSYGGRTMAEHPIDPIRWAASEFVLIDSHVGKTYHEIKGRWPLRA